MQKSAKPDCIKTEFYAVALGPVLKIGGSFIWIVVFYLFTNYWQTYFILTVCSAFSAIDA